MFWKMCGCDAKLKTSHDNDIHIDMIFIVSSSGIDSTIVISSHDMKYYHSKMI